MTDSVVEKIGTLVFDTAIDDFEGFILGDIAHKCFFSLLPKRMCPTGNPCEAKKDRKEKTREDIRGIFGVVHGVWGAWFSDK